MACGWVGVGQAKACTINLRSGCCVSSSCWHTFEDFLCLQFTKESDQGRQKEMLFTQSTFSGKVLLIHLVGDKAKVVANMGLMFHGVLETFLL